MYSFGMIGTGIIAGCHLEAIAAHTRTRLAAVADVVRPRAEAAAAPFGAAVYTSNAGKRTSGCRDHQSAAWSA